MTALTFDVPSLAARLRAEMQRRKSGREMTEYLNLLDAYCAENLGLLLPHPQDMYHEAMSRRAA